MRVRYTRPALADLDTILGYITARSPQGAKRVQTRIQDAINRLAHQPLIGARTGVPGIRRLQAIPYPYLIFYEAADDEVIIHAIRHGARDPSSMPGAT